MAVDPKTAAAVLGKIGRQANTPKQAEASRINGRKGGRPVQHGRRSRKRKHGAPER